jgi:hypothetical protein
MSERTLRLTMKWLLPSLLVLGAVVSAILGVLLRLVPALAIAPVLLLLAAMAARRIGTPFAR